MNMAEIGPAGNRSLTTYASFSLGSISQMLGPWWRQNEVPIDMEEVMMTSPNGNISALLALCAGNSPVTGEFPHKGQ